MSLLGSTLSPQRGHPIAELGERIVDGTMLSHRLSLGHALPDHRDDRRDVFERAIMGVIPRLRKVVRS